MSVATAGLYRVRWQGTLLGQQVENVYYYLNVQGEDDKAQELADAFDVRMSDDYSDALNNSYAFDNINVVALFGFAVEANVTPGHASGDKIGSVLSPQSALTIKLHRSDRTTNNGSKRIGGIDEQDVTDGVVDLLNRGLFQDLAQSMTVTLSDGGYDFSPVICRSADLVPNPTSINYAGISGYAIDWNISSQNSRKVQTG